MLEGNLLYLCTNLTTVMTYTSASSVAIQFTMSQYDVVERRDFVASLDALQEELEEAVDLCAISTSGSSP